MNKISIIKTNATCAGCLGFLLSLVMLFSCGKGAKKPNSVVFIKDTYRQDSIFMNLVKLTNITDARTINDSLAFLILPIQASCPSCRKKTIDSIVNHQNDLPDNHFVIISCTGGRKIISSYFKELGKELPVMPGRIFLDSTNEAFKHDLYDQKPTMYYTYNRKAYKMVGAVPSTVKDDLREFFSEQRKNKNLAKN